MAWRSTGSSAARPGGRCSPGPARPPPRPTSGHEARHAHAQVAEPEHRAESAVSSHTPGPCPPMRRAAPGRCPGRAASHPSSSRRFAALAGLMARPVAAQAGRGTAQLRTAPVPRCSACSGSARWRARSSPPGRPRRPTARPAESGILRRDPGAGRHGTRSSRAPTPSDPGRGVTGAEAHRSRRRPRPAGTPPPRTASADRPRGRTGPLPSLRVRAARAPPRPGRRGAGGHLRGEAGRLPVGHRAERAVRRSDSRVGRRSRSSPS
jgi:hypothetical protein